MGSVQVIEATTYWALLGHSTNTMKMLSSQHHDHVLGHGHTHFHSDLELFGSPFIKL